MTSRYSAPVRDMKFILHDVLNIEKHSNLPGFADATPDVVDAILEEGGKFASEVLHPLNEVGDKQGCKLDPETHAVKTPDGFPDAFRRMAENGWTALQADPEYGGQGLPHVVGYAVSEMTSAANMAFAMYPGLTAGAAEAIAVGGSDEQKRMYLPKMISGEWAGTMNLTEPHCGTDLGMLRTKAVPQGDGTYKITGQKIWISGGEQDLTDNIVQLVLARIEGAPEGVKGISLFIVPKFIPNEDGSLGERNSFHCGGLEEKMGIHGNATCVMNYEGATGWLVGEEHKGLKIMFVMMNAARLGVGVQGLAQSEVAYQNALAFANDRLQSRSITGTKRPDLPADPIIVHPDVRRMLMEAKSFNEAGRAFAYWTGLCQDLLEKSPDEEVRQKADDYMSLMTPIIKAFLTDRGYNQVHNSLQLFGGSGFTEDWPMSQFQRDARIALIYEGTNGIQALDLVGRKLMANGGRAWQTFFKEVDEFIGDHENDENLKSFVEGLRSAKAQLEEAIGWFGENALSNLDHAGASSHDFLQLFGLTAFSYMWALMAKAAYAGKAENADDPFYDAKLATGKYFLDRVLPETAAHLAKVKAGADAMMALEPEEFGLAL